MRRIVSVFVVLSLVFTISISNVRAEGRSIPSEWARVYYITDHGEEGTTTVQCTRVMLAVYAWAEKGDWDELSQDDTQDIVSAEVIFEEGPMQRRLPCEYN